MKLQFSCLDQNIDYIPVIQIDGDLEFEIYTENDCTEKFKEVFDNSSGIVFFGGWDIPPYFYGQKTELTTEIKTPNRHLFELSFLFHLLGGYQNPNFNNFLEERKNYTVLGICMECKP
ncbi:MAG: gamma-glutamyl-gamma-aminobutyrate hydrolase family protein [Saprospiraceae bacterium]